MTNEKNHRKEVNIIRKKRKQVSKLRSAIGHWIAEAFSEMQRQLSIWSYFGLSHTGI